MWTYLEKQTIWRICRKHLKTTFDPVFVAKWVQILYADSENWNTLDQSHIDHSIIQYCDESDGWAQLGSFEHRGFARCLKFAGTTDQREVFSEWLTVSSITTRQCTNVLQLFGTFVKMRISMQFDIQIFWVMMVRDMDERFVRAVWALDPFLRRRYSRAGVPGGSIDWYLRSTTSTLPTRNSRPCVPFNWASRIMSAWWSFMDGCCTFVVSIIGTSTNLRQHRIVCRRCNVEIIRGRE